MAVKKVLLPPGSRLLAAASLAGGSNDGSSGPDSLRLQHPLAFVQQVGSPHESMAVQVRTFYVYIAHYGTLHSPDD